jgi:hypothetical protein
MTVIGVEWRCRRLSLSVGSSVDELGRLGLASSATPKVRVRVKWHLVAQRIALAETCRPALMLAPAMFMLFSIALRSGSFPTRLGKQEKQGVKS